MKTTRRHPVAKARRGLLTLEMLFVLPFVLLLFVAALQYGRALVIHSAMTQAATVAAREAGKGADVEDIARAANCILASHGIEINGVAGSGLKIVLHDGCRSATQVAVPDATVRPGAAARRSTAIRTGRCPIRRAFGPRKSWRPCA